MVSPAVGSVAQLGFTAVGTAIGGPVGGLIGSFIGGLLFGGGPDQEGPRLRDLEVASSAYGTVIPLGYGLVKITGTIIWATEIVEKKDTKTHGGIFGIGGTDVTTYRYFANVAVAFGVGPAAAIPRIWAGSKLVLDQGTTETGTTELSEALGGGVSTHILSGTRVRIYLGTETQQPDPFVADKVLEETEEANATPAHRGIVYAVIERLPLEDFGNRIPNFAAEVNWGGADERPKISTTPLDGFFTRGDLGLYPDWQRRRGFMQAGADGEDRDGIASINLDTMVVEDVNPVLEDSEGRTYNPLAVMPLSGYVIAGATNRRAIVDPTSLEIVFDTEEGFEGAINPEPRGSVGFSVMDSFGATNEWYLDLRHSNWTLSRVIPVGPSLQTKVGSDFDHGSDFDIVALNDGATPLVGRESIGDTEAWIVSDTSFGSNPGTTLQLLRITVTATAEIAFISDILIELAVPLALFTFDATEIDPTATGLQCDTAVYMPSQDWIVIDCGLDNGKRPWIVVDRSGELVKVIDRPFDFGAGSRTVFHHSRVLGDEVAFASGSSVLVTNVRFGENVLNQDGWSGGGGDILYDSVKDVIYSDDDDPDLQQGFLRRASNSVPLQDVVEDLSERAGLDASEVDAGELSGDTVRGVALARQTTYRKALELLSAVYLFDAVESDFKLVFKKRGRSVSKVMEEDRLVPVGDNEDTLLESRVQDVELPAKMNVTFLDVERDGDRGVQTVKRVSSPDITMRSRDVVSLELPIVLSPGEAKGIAQSLLHSAWIERYENQFAKDWSVVDLDPADVIQINRLDGKVLTLRIAGIEFGANFQMQFVTVQEQGSSYSSSPLTDGGRQFRRFELPSSNASRLVIMDMPLLQDEHDLGRSAVRQYWSAGSEGFGNWPGGDLMFLDDGGFEFVGQHLIGMSWGVVASAVGGTDLPWQTDDDNTVVVTMRSGTLSGITELEMLQGGNLAALVDTNGEVEIINFRDVSSDPDRPSRYTLSRLLRGRRGTESFVGNHGSGTLLIMLEDETVEAQIIPLTSLDKERKWRFVGRGQAIAQTLPIAQTVIGRDMMPYAPHPLSSDVSLGSDVTITWERRSRIRGELANSTGEVPLSEDSEEYELEILDKDEVVLRTVTGLTDDSYVYTTAQQTTDGDPVHVRVYQISAQVGRGFGSQLLTFYGATATVIFGEEQTAGANGASNREFEVNRVFAQQYTVPETGTLKRVDLYCGIGTANIRAGVYADDGGAPGALLAESADGAVSDELDWVEFDLTGPLNVEENDVLWLVGHADSDVRSTTETGNNTGRRFIAQTFGSGLPDPFGSGSIYNNTRGIRGVLEIDL